MILEDMIGMSFVLTMHLEENANMENVCESMKVARKRWREARKEEKHKHESSPQNNRFQ